MITPEAIQLLIDQGASIGDVQTAIGVRPYRILPTGYGIVPVPDAELSSPWRFRQATSAFTPASFVEYWEKFKNSASRIFVDPNLEAPKIAGIVDFHGAERQPYSANATPTAGWKEHTLLYNFRNTPEWDVWKKSNGVAMKQSAFAEFIEENVLDIVHPAAAVMMEVSRNFAATSNANFSQATNMENGSTQLSYVLTVKGAAKQNEMQIPESFIIRIGRWNGNEPRDIECKLRYRLHENALTMWYQMVRPHKFVEASLKEIVDEITAGVEGTPITYGTSATP